MKKLLILILVSTSLFASAQVPQYNATWYNFRLSIIDSLGVPRDTFPVPSSLRTRPWLGTKGDNTYMWSVTQQKWIPVGSAGTVGVTSVNATGAGPLGVSGVPFTTSGTIALAWTGAGTDYVKANGGTGNFTNDVKAIGDARYAYRIHTHLFDHITNGVSVVRNLFSAGAGLSYNPATGVFSALDTLDPANYALITQLNDSMTTVRDSLTAIAARIGTGGGGGSTPTLQQVTDAGSTTTHAITTPAVSEANSKFVLIAPGGDDGRLYLSNFSNYSQIIRTQAAQTGGTFFLPNTNHTNDTLATLYDVRGLAGGGSTPTLDAVLTAGNSATHNILMPTDASVGYMFGTGNFGMYGDGTSVVLAGVGASNGTLKVTGQLLRLPYYGQGWQYAGTKSGYAPVFNTDGTISEAPATGSKIITKTFANDGSYITPLDGTILVNATGGATTLQLAYYADATAEAGGRITIKKTDSSGNAVTVSGVDYGYTIDGATSYSLTTQYQYITIQFTGTQWVVVGGN